MDTVKQIALGIVCGCLLVIAVCCALIADNTDRIAHVFEIAGGINAR